MTLFPLELQRNSSACDTHNGVYKLLFVVGYKHSLADETQLEVLLMNTVCFLPAAWYYQHIETFNDAALKVVPLITSACCQNIQVWSINKNELGAFFDDRVHAGRNAAFQRHCKLYRRLIIVFSKCLDLWWCLRFHIICCVRVQLVIELLDVRIDAFLFFYLRRTRSRAS